MPEGHIVHADAARFRAAMLGRPVHATSPQGRFADGAAVLDGRTLCSAEAHGKHLVLGFDADTHLHIHLGLIGAWTWRSATGTQTAGPRVTTASTTNVRVHLTPAAPPVSAHSASPGPQACSAELRGATTCRLLDEAQLDALLSTVGPDPIRDDRPTEAVTARVLASRTPIGTLLLDQAVAAGSGLIWRCEALFHAGISPFRPARDLTATEWHTLWTHLARLMRGAVPDLGSGPTTNGHSTDDLHATFAVFRRESHPCPACGTPVRSAPLTGRPVWWCPTHQPG